MFAVVIVGFARALIAGATPSDQSSNTATRGGDHVITSRVACGRRHRARRSGHVRSLLWECLSLRMPSDIQRG